jgi:RNA polymerase sigma-70 factor (ECF subfamily)
MSRHQAAAFRAHELSDAELVQLAWRGNSAAFGAVLDRHRVALFARALGFLGEREAAADAVQDAFVIALRRLDQLREPDKVGGWLHAIVRSVCAMRLRRGNPELPTANIASDAERLGVARSVEHQIDAMCLRDWVWAALAGCQSNCVWRATPNWSSSTAKLSDLVRLSGEVRLAN